MRDEVLQAISLLAATGIVGGGLYLLLDKAALIVAVDPERPASVSPPPAAVRTHQAPAVQEPRASTSSIYRCERGGAVVYSDTPCEGGRVVSIQVTRGFESEHYQRQTTSPQVAEQTPLPPLASSEDKSQAARNASLCESIDKAIEDIDAAARRGGSIQYMEDLKERRRKFVERRQELRC